MASICFYFHVHQPYRLKRYRVFDIGNDKTGYYTTEDPDLDNHKILRKVADKCYIPANKVMLGLLEKYPEFRISFSITGVFLDQARRFMPEIIDSFQSLIDTGRVELVTETYYHSLAFLYSKNEFDRQVAMHTRLLEETFGVSPKIFRNTELIYNNELAEHVEDLGFKGILAEGADHILNWRSPNFIHHPKGTNNIKMLLKNYKLSDDLAFRFSNKAWDEYPLSIGKYVQWLNAANGNGNVINLFMDYETFGEHQWEDTGIFKFLEAIPEEFLKHPDNDFVTPSEAIERYSSHGEIDIPNFISWADIERDLSAWRSNDMQYDALAKIYEIEEQVLQSGDKDLIEDWRRMQTSDHFYYMCTKWFSDGDVHKYFNPYKSPYEAFISFMNVFQDLKLRLENVMQNSSVSKNILSKRLSNLHS